MTKRLLIDASHAEETRVVVLDGNRLEDFDVETFSRRQLKGNIYLAKIVRVEPSLQAAFVEYGGNRHGFLAFGEIHPDYYQIPVADRQRLIEMQEEEARAEDEDGDAPFNPTPTIPGEVAEPLTIGTEQAGSLEEEAPEAREAQPYRVESDSVSGDIGSGTDEEAASTGLSVEIAESGDVAEPGEIAEQGEIVGRGADSAPEAVEPAGTGPEVGATETSDAESDLPDEGGRVRHIAMTEGPAPETIGGDTAEEAPPPRQPSRFMRSYKIQEVIRRRQILLVQVVKEERGGKGAALTTYISLAGRYCVLMPNSPRGGGISRKITSVADRRRLKEITTELEIPRGMGLIVRTAGAARPKPEIKRDGEYLLRLWDDIREQTMRSVAPALIHEEASLIKRAIRDVYSRDVDELLVDGEDGWRAARDYMRMLMPTHVKKVQLWPTGAQPLFAHSQVETMLDAMLSPTVQLRSGGYLVINQTEALVAIDVNSGRSTRERSIEETALRTNLEAAEEAARQLRLRDLAGLIVIDFIDMESKKHNGMVERRMADALRNDRARIQIGHISHFGLLELSRQRLRPSLAETSLNLCVSCGGTGHVRSTESAALHVLREIEEEGGKRRAAEILVNVASATALYILNNKRQRLTEIESRYGMRICFAPDETLLAARTRIETLRAALPQDLPELAVARVQSMPDEDAGEADIDDDESDVELGRARSEAAAPASAEGQGDFTTDADHVPGETAAEGEQRRRRRRRRRRGGRREDGRVPAETAIVSPDAEQPDILDHPLATPLVPVPGHDEATEASVAEAPVEVGAAPDMIPDPAAVEAAVEAEATPAKRGRRGGRRRRKPGEALETQAPDGEPEPISRPTPISRPAYVGPTPADPFALSGLDMFDMLEQAEREPAPPAFDTAAAADLHPALDAEADAEVTEPIAGAAVRQLEEAEMSHPAPLPHEPSTGSAVQPVLVVSGEAAPDRKKGWWRR